MFRHVVLRCSNLAKANFKNEDLLEHFHLP